VSLIVPGFFAVVLVVFVVLCLTRPQPNRPRKRKSTQRRRPRKADAVEDAGRGGKAKGGWRKA
jgi:hypothetical protein